MSLTMGFGNCFKKETAANTHNRMVFYGGFENYTRNGALLLAESVRLFDGRINPLRCLSIDELNTIVVDCNSWFHEDLFATWYKSTWEGRSVLLKAFKSSNSYYFELSQSCREIIIVTQMCNHKNGHRLLGCCLETEYPVLIYDGVVNGTLYNRILGNMNQNNHALKWKDRLRIAWEISYVISYLHTAFPRPIVYADLKPYNVFLGQDNVVILSDFTLSMSIPEGKTCLRISPLIGTPGYLDPVTVTHGELAESSDVFSFGVLLLVLLTRRDALFCLEEYISLVDWVKENFKNKGFSGIVDPAISIMETSEEFEQQLQVAIELALRCTAKEPESRPTMVDVAAQLKDMLSSSGLTLG